MAVVTTLEQNKSLLEMIFNTAVSELLKCNTIPEPFVDPFGYLWMANCILYSVIIAFYVCKGWKKRESNGGKDRAGRSKFNEMAKEKYESQASEIRAKLSKAKAEIERIKTNGKITKKGKRNRAKLMSCLLYTSPSPRDLSTSRMPSSA